MIANLMGLSPLVTTTLLQSGITSRFRASPLSYWQDWSCMHRGCQEIIGAAIPRDFPSRSLRIGLLHKFDYNESQRSSLYGHHIKKLFSVVNWPVITSTPLFRHYRKQVVAKNSPDIGFCQKIKVVSEGGGKRLLIGLTLLHSTHRTSEINLLHIIQKWSI